MYFAVITGLPLPLCLGPSYLYIIHTTPLITPFFLGLDSVLLIYSFSTDVPSTPVNLVETFTVGVHHLYR